MYSCKVFCKDIFLWEEKNLIERRKNGMNLIENTVCDPTGNMLMKNDGKPESDIIKISGIYKIINKVNGKYYVGSSKLVKRRLSEHKTYLRSNRHFNSHLQFAWNKYGENNFDFTFIEKVPICKLLIIEQKYLNKSNKTNSYNTSFIADRPEMSIETRLKISNSHKGKILSEAHKQKLRVKSTGRKFSKEFSEKMRKIRTGKVCSEQTKQKLREAFRGSKSHFYGRGDLIKGDRSPVYNHTIYEFRNKQTGEIFTGTQYQFRIKYNLSNDRVSRLTHGKTYRVKEWILNKV